MKGQFLRLTEPPLQPPRALLDMEGPLLEREATLLGMNETLFLSTGTLFQANGMGSWFSEAG